MAIPSLYSAHKNTVAVVILIVIAKAVAIIAIALPMVGWRH